MSDDHNNDREASAADTVNVKTATGERSVTLPRWALERVIGQYELTRFTGGRREGVGAMPPETLVRVIAPHFVAGLIVRDGICTEAAPILRRACMGLTANQLRALFKRRGWVANIVKRMD